jgi:hypothetical protein
MIVSISSAAARGALVGVALASAVYLSYFSVRTARDLLWSIAHR